MSFHQLWLRSIQLDEKLPTNWFSINPFKAIWLHFQLSPPAQILWWCSHTRRGDATFVSQQVHFHSTTVLQISLNILPPGGKLGQKMALKIVRLWIGFTFQEMSSGLWVSFRRRVSSGTSDHSPPLSSSPSTLKPQVPQDVSQPNVILSRIFFLPPFFLPHSIPGWTHSLWSWS